MRTMMYANFLVICCFAMSEQSCMCGLDTTQQQVCYSPIIVEAKIESFSKKAYYIHYQISVTKFYKGEKGYDALADKTTLETPTEYTGCGPVDLKVGSSYILTVSVYRGKMEHSTCDLQVEASSATNALLEGLAGKYQENCDCEIPYYGAEPQFIYSKDQCGPLQCDNRDIVCARDDNGQCSWRHC
ncbi:metalloproteinase inhibitor 3-like [Mytilus galloprovincialis]|uniref:metalloproteinase inhibitor 3-like n=1 Tax=Mytilus galloprovincialis TaxID=29158 RepID=UPI003F7B68B9